MFSRDIRSVPWTDTVGDQQPYAKAVALWCSFHDILDVHTTNKPTYSNRGRSFLSNMYGRPEDFVSAIETNILAGQDSVQMILERIFKRDSMSVT